jgi:hypothetical protein
LMPSPVRPTDVFDKSSFFFRAFGVCLVDAAH